MAVELFVEPHVPSMDWQDFIDSYPPYSIALDGYVTGGPYIMAKEGPRGPYWCGNHHEGVDRLATLSTAQQVARYLRNGLYEMFQVDGELTAQVYANDCDEDVSLAWWLLENSEQTRNPNNERLDRFLDVAGTLDATAGTHPYDPSSVIMGEMAWVFEPYRTFRASGDMARNDPEQYRTTIAAVGERISLHMVGNGERIALDTRYETVHRGQGWKMFREIGALGRLGAFYDGTNAYVICREDMAKQGEPTWCYTVGKRSDCVPFDVTGILAHLNEVEGCMDEDRWGGSSIIGGSPRVAGSNLTPEEVAAVIDAYLARNPQ
jgi:hypothetical protein